MKKIIVGLALIPLSFVAPALAAVIFLSTLDHGILFTGPGVREFAVPKAGKYYVWNQYQGLYEGKHYELGEKFPPEATFLLKKIGNSTDIPSEESLPFSPETSISTDLGDNKKNSIGFFTVPEPGRYALAVSGLREERLLSWSPSLFENITLITLGFILASGMMFACIVAAIVMLILGIMEWSKKSKFSTDSTPPADPSL